MELNHAINPHVPLSAEDEERLANFVNSPEYESLKRLNQWLRWTEVNVELIKARNPFEIGACQGGIGMINQQESYINGMMEEKKEAEVTQSMEEKAKLAFDSAFEQVDSEEDPLADVGDIL